MSNLNIEQQVEQIVEPIILDLGYELERVEYVKEYDNYYLRIFIDKQGSVSIDDCEIVSRKVNDLIDEVDIKEAYILEVSSPGIERVIKTEKQYLKYIGQKVEIKLFKKVNDKKSIIGQLVEYSNNSIKIIDIDTGETIDIDKENISHAKTVYDF